MHILLRNEDFEYTDSNIGRLLLQEKNVFISIGLDISVGSLNLTGSAIVFRNECQYTAEGGETLRTR